MLRTSFGRIRPGHPTTSYPGVAQLVARLLWDHQAGSSSLPSRTRKPLKSTDFRGFFLFLVYCGARIEPLV